MMPNEMGVYVCVTMECKHRNEEVQHEWNASWPLEQRRKKCRSCKKFMLLCAIKKTMTDEAKQKLRDLAARRKEKV